MPLGKDDSRKNMSVEVGELVVGGKPVDFSGMTSSKKDSKKVDDLELSGSYAKEKDDIADKVNEILGILRNNGMAS